MALGGAHFGIGEDYHVVISAFDGRGVVYESGPIAEYPHFTVTNYTHGRVEFHSPEGQSDGHLALELRVGGQPSNRVPFNYSGAACDHARRRSQARRRRRHRGRPRRARRRHAPHAAARGAADGGRHDRRDHRPQLRRRQPGADLQRHRDGLGDTATGGAVRIRSFSVTDDAASRFTVVSHELIQFVVPAGVGVNKTLVVRVGSMRSNEVVLSYAPPSISYADAAAACCLPDDTFEIHGLNFGFHGAVQPRPTSSTRPCASATSRARASSSRRAAPRRCARATTDGDPYLWCQVPPRLVGEVWTSSLTVGTKNISINIGGQTISYDATAALIFGTCDDDFHGQPAWTVHTLDEAHEPPFSCYRECTPRQTWCMERWNGNGYDDTYDAATGEGIDCWAVDPCAPYDSAPAEVATATGRPRTAP